MKEYEEKLAIDTARFEKEIRRIDKKTNYSKCSSSPLDPTLFGHLGEMKIFSIKVFDWLVIRAGGVIWEKIIIRVF